METRQAERLPYDPLGGSVGPLARFISLILRCSVRRLMPSFLAAAVTLPFVVASACMINFFSVSCRSSGLDLFAKSFGGGDTARRRRFGCLSHRHREIAQRDFWTGCHHNSVLDRGAELANVARPIVGKERVHGVGRQIDKRLLV